MFDWQNIDTVLLDMDGTLLDLHFDTYFWLEHLPLRYAQIHKMDQDEARSWLHERIIEQQGTLNWYCLDYWTRELNVPITLPKSLGRWGYAQVSVRFNEFIWLEDLISRVQQAIRAGVESASVESLCGQLGDTLKDTSAISWFRVEVENLADGCSTFATVESTL